MENGEWRIDEKCTQFSTDPSPFVPRVLDDSSVGREMENGELMIND
jgi:hypothetical protein